MPLCLICGEIVPKEKLSTANLPNGKTEMCDWCYEEVLNDEEKDSQGIFEIAAAMKGGG